MLDNTSISHSNNIPSLTCSTALMFGQSHSQNHVSCQSTSSPFVYLSVNPQSPPVCEAESASCPRASHPSRRSPLSPWWSMPLWVFLTIGRWTVIAFRWIYPDWGDKACIIVCLSWFHYSWTHVMLWTTSCVNSHAQVLHHTSISHCNNIPSMFQERQLWLFW